MVLRHFPLFLHLLTVEHLHIWPCFQILLHLALSRNQDGTKLKSFINDTIGTRLETVHDKDISNFDTHRVFCNNGVYDERRRAAGLDPFTPYTSPDFAQLYGDDIRLMKLDTNYNPSAINVFIHNDVGGTDWDILSHLKVPFSNDVQVWTQFTHFAIRRMSGGYGVQLTNAKEGAGSGTSGQNGKSGLVLLLSHVIGDDQVVSTPLERWQDDFALQELPHKYVILVTESGSTTNSGKSISNIALYKTLCRYELLYISRKFLTSIFHVFHGANALASNGIINFVEKDDSSFRKVIYLRCDKQLPLRDYVVSDYIKRQDMKEFLLKYLLDMDFIDEFSKDLVAALEPDKNDIKAELSMVRGFMEEVVSGKTANDEDYFYSDSIVPFDML